MKEEKEEAMDVHVIITGNSHTLSKAYILLLALYERERIFC
jgi:hypothetical protein